jgi:hypothetical protein
VGRGRVGPVDPGPVRRPAPTRNIVPSVGLVPVCALAVMAQLPYAFYGMAKNLQDCTAGANTAIVAADCNS